MKRVGVTELRRRLSRYLRLVKQGETIEVLERSVPFARLSGLRDEDAPGEEILARLVRDRVVIPAPARRRPDRSAVASPPVPCAADPANALIEERE